MARRMKQTRVGTCSVFALLAFGAFLQAQTAPSGYGGTGTGAGSFGSSPGGSSFGSSMPGGNSSSGTSTASGTNFAPQSLVGSVQSLGNSRLGGGRGASSLSGVTSGVSASNILGPYYYNPLAGGLPNVTQTTFGMPLYTTTTTTSGFSSTTRSTGGSSYGSGYSGLGAGGSVAGPAPSYGAAVGFQTTPAVSNRVQSQVQQVLAQSTSLSPDRAIQVEISGATLVLRGKVASEHDRHLAEGLVRLTPGVHSVRNELQTPEVPVLPPGLLP